MSFFSRLFSGSKNSETNLDLIIDKSKKSFWSKITNFLQGKSDLDTHTLLQIEELLIQADVGIDTTEKIIQELENRHHKKSIPASEVISNLKDIIYKILIKPENNKSSKTAEKIHIILVVGVNGVGKTTTIAKLAHFYKKQDLQVLIAAADTFRAAATEQLSMWAERVGCDIVKQGAGADPSAVAFDAVSKALAKNYNILIIDTAGRLHNKPHLMEELNKIKRVIQKKVPEAPHEILLVIDGSTGQNAVQQAKEFSKVTPITDLVVTKLDGTAKGGVLLAITDQLHIPVSYVGTGEKLDDLTTFQADKFIDALLS